MKCYLAGPFFNPQQKAVIESLEKLVKSEGLELFSPRLVGGVLTEMTPEQKSAAVDKIFQSNVDGIDDCDVVLAVVDDRDPGTIFEIGFAYAKSQTYGSPLIITFTNHSYGVNIMISKCVDAHARGLDELKIILGHVMAGNKVGLQQYHNFSPDVT